MADDLERDAARVKRTTERMSSFTMPKMGNHALNVEAGLYGYLSNAGMKASGGQGTGIITVCDKEGRVFKVELSQVDGPQ